MKCTSGRFFVTGTVLCVLAVLGACGKDEIIGQHAANQPPTVWIAAAPPEGSVGTYTVQLFWGGWDPDGEIAYYEYFITDNVTGVFNPADTVGGAWLPVHSNDSTFTFSADSLSTPGPPPQPQRGTFIRSHTFFIRAVDEGGLRTKEPAYRSFTSRTISPEVRITVPRADLGNTPADIPPISTITWNATDFIDDMDTKQDPDSVQWALVSTNLYGGYARTIDSLKTPSVWARHAYPWAWYKAPGDSGKKWTTPPLSFGNYVIGVRAKDEAGAVTPVLQEPVNLRRLRVQQRTAGPNFVVSSTLMGSVIAASCDYPLTIVDVPSGVDISFTLSACADSYGGTVVGYRYGWDILDLNDPDQWEISYTPFVKALAFTPPRAFNFGTHTFTGEVIDNSGFCSRIEIKVNIIRFTGGRNLLVVDDYSPDEVENQSGWDKTLGGVPSDGEHDGFWLDMVSDLDGFDPNRDMIGVANLDDIELPLTTIADYKNIIWSVFGHIDTSNPSDLPMLYTYIQYRSKLPPGNTGGACGSSGGTQGKVIPDFIGLAMQAGVHVIIAGHHPIQNVKQRVGGLTVTWPMIPLYELERPQAQCGTPRSQDLTNPPGDESFTYRELCLDVIDYALLTPQRARYQRGPAGCNRYCPINAWRDSNGSLVDDTMRGGIPADPNFDPIALRPEAAGTGRAYAPNVKGIDAEVYNPAYFRQGAACSYVLPPRPCFEPIYLLDCLDQSEKTYQQPVAFWTGAFADVVGDDIPNGVAARSAVFGFPPVYFNPASFKRGIEYILYDEWQLPRRTPPTSASR